MSEIQLQTRRLAEIDVNYAFGEGLIGDRAALIVVTEGESGGKLSVQLKRRPQAAAGRSNFDHSPCYEQGMHEKANGAATGAASTDPRRR